MQQRPGIGSLFGLHLCLLPRPQTLPCASSHEGGRVGHGVSIQLEYAERVQNQLEGQPVVYAVVLTDTEKGLELQRHPVSR